MTLPGCSQGGFPGFVPTLRPKSPANMIAMLVLVDLVCQPGRAEAGQGAVVGRHYLPAQQNCAGTWRRSPGRKGLSLSSGESTSGCKSKGGSSVPNRQTPSWCQFPELQNLLSGGIFPSKFCFAMTMWMVTAGAQTRAPPCRAEQNSLQHLKFKASHSL